MSHYQRFIQAIAEKKGDPTLIDSLTKLWSCMDLCPIILQSGIRKGRACEKPRQVGKKTCFHHAELHMCTHTDCMRKCKEDETQCEFHQAEERKLKESQCIYPSIRWQDPFYVIKGTNIIIDIDNHVLRGYKKDNQCIPEENHDVREACKHYNLRFVKDTTLVT